MVTKICERCDIEMRLIPAGISKKTGKPYSAFWSCDKRNGGCGETARAEGDAAQSAPAAQQQYSGGSGGGVSHSSGSNEQLNRIEQKLDQVIAFLKQ
ncbi:MAG: hypothetical protein V1738_00315 [Patescibacteria group bacterium]